MPQFQQQDPIRFLLDRKYGKLPVDFALRRLDDPDCLPDARGEPPAEVIDEIQAEYAALRNQPAEQTRKSVEIERALIAAEKERQFPFSEEKAPADFEYWARASFWTIEEGIALIMGRDPRKAATKTTYSYRHSSEFARRYLEQLELAERAMSMRQIWNKNTPGSFVAWAKRSRLEIDPRLETALEAFGVEIGDWKSTADRQKETIDELNGALTRVKASAEELASERDTLRRQLAELQNAPPTPDTIGQKERTSLLKLVVGMAVRGYGFDPAKTRNDATKEIADDLELLGIPLDRGTILKWLNEGADLLPRELEDD